MKRQLCSTIVTKFQGKKLIWIFEFANAGLFHSFVNNSFQILLILVFLKIKIPFYLFQETLELLVQEEEKRNAIEQAKKKAEAEVKVLQSDLHDLEAQMIKSEQSRKEKEHQIRTMQDELEQQEDVIARLHKEKRHLQV